MAEEDKEEKELAATTTGRPCRNAALISQAISEAQQEYEAIEPAPPLPLPVIHSKKKLPKRILNILPELTELQDLTKQRCLEANSSPHVPQGCVEEKLSEVAPSVILHRQMLPSDNQADFRIETNLNYLIEGIKRDYMEFIERLKTSQYSGRIQREIALELDRKKILTNRKQTLESQISRLSKEGLDVLKQGMKMLDIQAETPKQFIAKAKLIVSRHTELERQARRLEEEIAELEEEQPKLLRMKERQLLAELGIRSRQQADKEIQENRESSDQLGHRQAEEEEHRRRDRTSGCDIIGGERGQEPLGNQQAEDEATREMLELVRSQIKLVMREQDNQDKTTKIQQDDDKRLSSHKADEEKLSQQPNNNSNSGNRNIPEQQQLKNEFWNDSRRYSTSVERQSAGPKQQQLTNHKPRQSPDQKPRHSNQLKSADQLTRSAELLLQQSAGKASFNNVQREKESPKGTEDALGRMCQIIEDSVREPEGFVVRIAGKQEDPTGGAMNLSLMSGSQRDESIRPGELEDSLHFTNTNKYKQPTSSTFETQHQQEDQRQTSNMPTFAADERYQRPLTVNADSVPVALGPASADSGYRTSNCGSAALAGPISAGSYKSTRSTSSAQSADRSTPSPCPPTAATTARPPPLTRIKEAWITRPPPTSKTTAAACDVFVSASKTEQQQRPPRAGSTPETLRPASTGSKRSLHTPEFPELVDQAPVKHSRRDPQISAAAADPQCYAADQHTLYTSKQAAANQDFTVAYNNNHQRSQASGSYQQHQQQRSDVVNSVLEDRSEFFDYHQYHHYQQQQLPGRQQLCHGDQDRYQQQQQQLTGRPQLVLADRMLYQSQGTSTKVIHANPYYESSAATADRHRQRSDSEEFGHHPRYTPKYSSRQGFGRQLSQQRQQQHQQQQQQERHGQQHTEDVSEGFDRLVALAAEVDRRSESAASNYQPQRPDSCESRPEISTEYWNSRAGAAWTSRGATPPSLPSSSLFAEGLGDDSASPTACPPSGAGDVGNVSQLAAVPTQPAAKPPLLAAASSQLAVAPEQLTASTPQLTATTSKLSSSTSFSAAKPDGTAATISSSERSSYAAATAGQSVICQSSSPSGLTLSSQSATDTSNQLSINDIGSNQTAGIGDTTREESLADRHFKKKFKLQYKDKRGR